MIEKLSWLFITSSLFIFSGCVNRSIDGALPNCRPLGEEFPVYQPLTEPSPMAADAPPVAEPNGIVTLQQALAVALMHNPELRAFSWEVRAAEARQLQAGLMPNPEFEVEVEGAGGSGERSGFDGAETTILLSQSIELGNKRTRRTELAALEKQLTGWDYEGKRLDVFTEVSKAFVEVLAEQERVELAEDVVRLSREVLSTVRQRVEAGKDSPVEQTKGQVALANAEIELEKTKSNLESARKRLSATWAGRSAVFEKAAGELDSTVPVPSFDELADLIGRNPDIARWAVEMDQRRAAVELARANAIQDVKVGGGMQRFNKTGDNAFVFGVAIPIPLFDRNQGNILEAGHKLAKAKAESQAVETRIHAGLAQEYAKLSSAFQEATDLRDKVLEGAQSAFDAASEGYRAGKLGFLDVLDAQRTLFEAKAKYIDALAAYHGAKADVERLLGQPIESGTISRSEDEK
ncbi:MAG: TolC family protein [Planctomycetota bacterium]|jgi:cobalt-zinc-cadmium efflux system outer membrane protein